MSYDIYFVDPKTGATIQLEEEHHFGGGTYAVAPPDMVTPNTREAWLNVTYNYGKHFHFRDLDGKNVEEVLHLLTDGMLKLGDEMDADYWKPTEGNVKKALIELLRLANRVPPDSVVRVG